MRNTLHYRRIYERRWRLLRVHYTGGLARLLRLGREERKHVRLDWKGEEPPCNMHDVRAAAAPLALKL